MTSDIKIIYVDMVADLLHYGHLNYLKQIYETLIEGTSNKLYVGILNNESVKLYKRNPVLTMKERINVISFCSYIDKVIPNAPLTVTEDYIKLYNIHKICIPNNRTKEETELMYPNLDGMLEIFDYTPTISTSEIIKRIKNREDL
jgi:cytidyltransferase-like protein